MSSNKDFITILIVEWKKYSSRTDVKKPLWFRCNNDILTNSKMFSLSLEEICVWIYLLGQNSDQNNQGVVHVSYHHAHHSARLTLELVTSALEKLKKLKMIKIVRTRTDRGRYAREQDLALTLHNKTLHNKTGQDTTHPIVSGGRGVLESFSELAGTDPRVREALLTVDMDIQQMWVDTYPDREWREQRIREAIQWHLAKASERGSASFKWPSWITSWLLKKHADENPSVTLSAEVKAEIDAALRGE